MCFFLFVKFHNKIKYDHYFLNNVKKKREPQISTNTNNNKIIWWAIYHKKRSDNNATQKSRVLYYTDSTSQKPCLCHDSIHTIFLLNVGLVWLCLFIGLFCYVCPHQIQKHMTIALFSHHFVRYMCVKYCLAFWDVFFFLYFILFFFLILYYMLWYFG